MNSTFSRTIGLASTTALVFSLLACVHPNHITFIIRANGDVNVAPQKGDKIKWVQEIQDTNGNVTTIDTSVKFGKYKDNVPCAKTKAGQDVDTCVITSVDTSYLYVCKAANGLDCVDPHVGPGTRTSLSKTGPPMGLVVTDTGNPEPHITCSTSGNNQYSADVDSIDNASKTGIIQWTQDPKNGVRYSFTLVDPSNNAICVDPVTGKDVSQFSSDHPLQLCVPSKAILGKTYTYEVTFAGNCQGQTKQGTLTMASPTTAPAQ